MRLSSEGRTQAGALQKLRASREEFRTAGRGNSVPVEAKWVNGKGSLKFALVRDGLVILYSEILWKLVVRSHLGWEYRQKLVRQSLSHFPL